MPYKLAHLLATISEFQVPIDQLTARYLTLSNQIGELFSTNYFLENIVTLLRSAGILFYNENIYSIG